MMGSPSCGSEASYTIRCFPFARLNHSSASPSPAPACAPNGKESVEIPAAVPANTWPRNLLLGFSFTESIMVCLVVWLYITGGIPVFRDTTDQLMRYLTSRFLKRTRVTFSLESKKFADRSNLRNPIKNTYVEYRVCLKMHTLDIPEKEALVRSGEFLRLRHAGQPVQEIRSGRAPVRRVQMPHPRFPGRILDT